MNSTALATMVVTICIICPLCIGFIWPAGESTEIGYTTEGDMEISQSLNNDTSPIDYDFNSYLNNLLFYDSSAAYYTPYYETTDVMNNYPAMDYEHRIVGEKTILGTPDKSYWSYYAAICYESVNDSVITVNGERVNYLVVFPGGDGFAMKGATRSYELVTVPNGDFYVERAEGILTGTTVNEICYPQLTISTVKQYIDMDAGIKIGSVKSWMNGEVNSKVSILIDPSESSFRLKIGDVDVTVSAYNNKLEAYLYGQDPVEIGAYSTYTKAMVEFDSEKDTVTVTGLMNLDGFTKYSPSKRGNSVTFDVVFDPFTHVSIWGPYPDGAMMVYSATILTDPVPVMNDAVLTFSDYYADNQLSLVFNSITQYGDSLVFNHVSGQQTAHAVLVQDGYLKNVPFADGNGGTTYEDVKLYGMVLAMIPDEGSNASHLMINGKFTTLGLPGGIHAGDTFQITFTGIWKMIITAQDVVAYEYTAFTWEPGNFGMSATGFCTIGMLVAGLMTVVCSLYARSTGMSVIIPLIASFGCAGVYLTMLFSL